jgi:uncharacterized delta-60 repeat protein
MFKNLRRSVLGFAVIASSIAVVPVAVNVATAADGTIDASNWSPASGGLAKFTSSFTEGGSAVSFSAVGGYVDSSGKPLLIGNVGDYGAQTPALVRMTTSGVVDTTFDGNGLKVLENWNTTTSTYVNEVRSSGSSIYLLGGAGTGFFMGDKPFILKISESGAIDTSWGASGWVIASEAGQMVSNQGSFYIGTNDIYILGYRSIQGSNEAIVHKFSKSTGLPVNMGASSQNYMSIPTSTWNSGQWHAGIFPANGGKVVIYTQSNSGGQGMTTSLYRFDVSMFSAQLDSNFGNNGVLNLSVPVYNIFPPEINGSGLLLVGGERDDTNGPFVKMAQLNSDGTLDTTWGTSGYATLVNFDGLDANQFARMSDGTFILRGSRPPVQQGQSRQNTIVKLTAGGALDTSFNSDGFASPSSQCGLYGGFIPSSNGNFFQFGSGTEYNYNTNPPTQVNQVLVLKWSSGGLAASSCTGNPPTPVITPSSVIISGTVGVPITSNAAPVLSNFLSTPTFARSQYSSQLPAGLDFNAQTGVISGTPTAQSTAFVSFEVGNGTQTGTYSVNFNINPASNNGGVPVGGGGACTGGASISPSSTTGNGTVGQSMSLGGPVTSGYTGAVTFSVSGVPLPSGLTLNPQTGAVTGTPQSASYANVIINVVSGSQSCQYNIMFAITSSNSGGSQTCTTGAPSVVGTNPTLDPSFGTGGAVVFTLNGGSSALRSGVATNDGNVVVAESTFTSNDSVIKLHKFTPAGVLVTGFGTGGVLTIDKVTGSTSENVYAIRELSDGSLALLYSISATPRENYVVKVTAAGILDTSWATSGFVSVGTGTNLYAREFKALSDNSMIVYKSGSSGGTTTNELVKVLANGTLDSSFGTSGSVSLAEDEFNFDVSSSGSIVVGGANSATPSAATIRKFSSAGVLDLSWSNSGILTLAQIGSQGDDNFVNDVAVDSSGRLYAAVMSSSMQSMSSTTKLLRLLSDGTLDSSFGGGAVLPSSIWNVDDIFILRDGNILLTAMSGMYSPEMGVALVSSSGVLDSAFATAFAVTQLGNCKLSDMGVTQGTNGEVFAFGSKYGAASSGSLWKLNFSGVAGGGGSNVDTPSTPATPVADTPSTPATPAADTPSTPATTAAVPTLVTSANAAALVRTPGSESIIVNGEEVVIESNTVNIPAARTPESQRTPAQVASIQQAGAALLQQFLASLPAGATSNVVVVNTATGAVMRNLVFDANGNAIDVPVEDIVFLDGPQLSLMIGSSNASITADGKYQVGAGGVVGVTGSGLGAGTTGELVAMSTPTLLANFQTTAAGDFTKSATLPSSIGVGDHTLVVAAGSTYAMMGIRVVPAALPTTGTSTENVVIIALFTLVFGALFFRGRRSSLI